MLLDDLPVPRLRVYPRYTVITDKFEAIVSLRITQQPDESLLQPMDSATLRRAITATFVRRATALPTTTPIGLSDATDATRETQWRAFV